MEAMETMNIFCMMGLCLMLDAASPPEVPVHVVRTVVVLPPCAEPQIPLVACEPQ